MSTDLSITEIWNQTLTILKDRLSRPSFETWLKSTHPQALKNGCFLIEVPNEFAREWLESRYAEPIEEIIHSITKKTIKVKFLVEIDNQESISQQKPQPKQRKALKNTSTLDPRYSFENFVVGESNRFAHAASLAVAEAPAKAYNPLFIYGDVGLGKTHLMHAIGQYINNHFNDLEILYISSESFTNELINSIRDDKTVEFRNKYRNIDVLLVDDIQFLAGKERTQEEFFHTFNALHGGNRQLIISSDRPPREIPTLEDRLRSRFEWGLITDIQRPDLETRIAILRKKASLEGYIIPDDVVTFIANNIHSNIRELEGALNSCRHFSVMKKIPITVETAKEALKDKINISQKKLTILDIQQAVSDFYSINSKEMLSKKRNQNIVFPRQVAMYLARELTDFSLPQIGESFGGRDHSTVIHSCDKIVKKIENDISFKATLTKLQEKISNRK